MSRWTGDEEPPALSIAPLAVGAGRLTFLGTGTSVGVPMVGCSCPACTSADPRDNRLRSSVLLEWHDGTSPRVAVIDTTPELRLQLLRERVSRLDAVLITHNHADHIHGLDDVRPFCFRQDERIPVYGRDDTLAWTRQHYAYVWEAVEVGGGLPRIDLFPVREAFTVRGLPVTPLEVLHGQRPIYGYRFGNCAYISDVSQIPEETFRQLEGVDTLILDAVRYKPHKTHFHLEAAVAAARRVGARQTYFTHMNHDFLHGKLSDELPSGMAPAYDGLRLPFSYRACASA